MPKKDVRLVRIFGLDTSKMLAWANTVGNGNRGCWLDRGLLSKLDSVETGTLLYVTFDALGEPISVRPAGVCK
jgi:hypothetical protein